MDDFGIPALSVSMNQADVQQQFGISVLKMAMEVPMEETELIETALENLDTSVGQNIDINA
ncbi:MAG: YjfB family protein [Veillonellaceae bacterium]|nr:YjfB family protein [Veillonellaceae bacterium]